MRPVRAAARALLSGIFVVQGARAVANPEPLVPGAKVVTDRLGPLLEQADRRLPNDPRSLVRVNGAVQLGAGLLLAAGVLTRPAAAVLAGSLVPTTVARHPYWTIDNPVRRANEQMHLLKNVSLLGGLLLASADTQGRPGLGWRTRHAVRTGKRSVRRSLHSARREARLAMASTRKSRLLPG